MYGFTQGTASVTDRYEAAERAAECLSSILDPDMQLVDYRSRLVF